MCSSVPPALLQTHSRLHHHDEQCAPDSSTQPAKAASAWHFWTALWRVTSSGRASFRGVLPDEPRWMLVLACNRALVACRALTRRGLHLRQRNLYAGCWRCPLGCSIHGHRLLLLFLLWDVREGWRTAFPGDPPAFLCPCLSRQALSNGRRCILPRTLGPLPGSGHLWRQLLLSCSGFMLQHCSRLCGTVQQRQQALTRAHCQLLLRQRHRVGRN
mmetsp:Transcript_39444/g.91498  ORF Transcript_39444/g.91498 Transcript_39444/m.91498 type:complete len:215 (-) Transcript_39444:414-1058(-)